MNKSMLNKLLLISLFFLLVSCGEEETIYSCDNMEKLTELSLKNDEKAQKTLVKCLKKSAKQAKEVIEDAL